MRLRVVRRSGKVIGFQEVADIPKEHCIELFGRPYVMTPWFRNACATRAAVIIFKGSVRLKFWN